MRGALMVCGTSRGVGKSHFVAALCRLLARDGVRVAPFKAESAGANPFVTPEGHEIGRAQAMQATAAGVEPDVSMNPILIKPAGQDRQVMVMGRPWRMLDAAAYRRTRADLRTVVVDALADLRSRFDVVLCEGTGSPVEFDGLEHDLTNLSLASDVGIPAIVVGDMDRGGAFASLYGTLALAPERLRPRVRGFVINRFRGDPALLTAAIEDLEERCGVPVLGVLPPVGGRASDPDGVLAAAAARPAGERPAGERPAGAPVQRLDVAVVRFPKLSDFSDVDALGIEPGVSLRFVDRADSLGDPDMVVLPGTTATAEDLAWFRSGGFDLAVGARRDDGEGGVRPDSPMILGIGGGYQMLGTRIDDPGSVETREGTVAGLGWLDLHTVLLIDKRTRHRRGRTSWHGMGAEPGSIDEMVGSPRQAPAMAVSGREISYGRVHPGPTAVPWLLLGDQRGKRNEGIVDDRRGVLGTSLHGMLEGDAFRNVLLKAVAERRGRVWTASGVSFGGAEQGQLDRRADLYRDRLDVAGLWRLAAEGGATSVPVDESSNPTRDPGARAGFGVTRT